MLCHLPASVPVSEHRRAGFLAAVVLHIGLIGAAVVATGHQPAAQPSVTGDVPFYLPPPDERAPAPDDLPDVTSGAAGMKDVAIPSDAIQGTPIPDWLVPSRWTHGGLPPGRDVPSPARPGVFDDGPSGPIAAAIADEPPVRLAGPMPIYPELLRQAGVSGDVVLEVVIDTTGHPEAESLKVIASPHPALTAAACRVVLASIYRPGRLAGRGVPVLIRQTVRFRLD